MVTDVNSRERRLRRQAELQSLYVNLSSLRNQEKSYISAQAAIPDLLIQQIGEARQQIKAIEAELLELKEATLKSPAYDLYWQAVEAETAEAFDQATRAYKGAARQGHPDAGEALASLRYRLKARDKAASRKAWLPAPASQPRRLPLGLLAIFLILLLLAVIFILSRYLFTASEDAVALDETNASFLSTPTSLVVIVPSTATPLPTATPTATPLSSPTPTPTATPRSAIVAVTSTATRTPTPVPTLMAAPSVIGPSDGLVWKDGAIVFEFEDRGLAYDELYCLDTLRGYDDTLTENWSFPATGSQDPSIVIDASVFRIAELQDIGCVAWSAYIGKDSCDTPISRRSEQRIIGLPQPCDLK